MESAASRNEDLARMRYENDAKAAKEWIAECRKSEEMGEDLRARARISKDSAHDALALRAELAEAQERMTNLELQSRELLTQNQMWESEARITAKTLKDRNEGHDKAMQEHKV